MRAAYHEIVAADDLARLLVELFEECARGFPHDGRERRRIAGAVRVAEWRFVCPLPIALRCRGWRRPDRMVQRRILDEQIASALRSHFFCDPLAIQFFLPSGGQGSIHVQADQVRIGGSPRARLVSQRDKLQRKLFSALHDIFIYPARVGFQQSADFWRRICGGTFGGLTHAEGSAAFVEIQGDGAEDLREIAGGGPAQQVHLPEAVLGHHVTLRSDGILD